MSDTFTNFPKSTALPDIQDFPQDPNHTALDANDSNLPSTGKTKITPTDKSGTSYQGATGYGFMTNDPSMKVQGNAPSGENSSGIPAAKPITVVTFGDPNNTAG